MLAVAVHLEGGVKIVLGGVAKAGLHGSADPQVVRKINHPGAGLAGNAGGGIRRAVVNDKDGRVGKGLPRALHDGADAALLVIGRHDNQQAPRGH